MLVQSVMAPSKSSSAIRCLGSVTVVRLVSAVIDAALSFVTSFRSMLSMW